MGELRAPMEYVCAVRAETDAEGAGEKGTCLSFVAYICFAVVEEKP